MASHPDVESVLADLARPGRLTAALNWYRANLSAVTIRRWPRSRVPTLGPWGSSDKFLAEDQMQHSERYVDSEWSYGRLDGAGHWLPRERPDEVAQIILEWMRDRASESAPTRAAAR